MKRSRIASQLVTLALVFASVRSVGAQTVGSAGSSGSAAPNDVSGAGSAGSAGTGSAGSAGSASTGPTDGSGSAAPGAGANGVGSGSSTSSGSASSASSGSGSAAGGSGSSTTAPTVDLPVDIAAPEVAASVSHGEVRLGSAITLFVTAAYRPDVVVNLVDGMQGGNAAPSPLGPDFEIGRVVASDSKRSDGKLLREWQIEIFPFELGDVAIPPVQITYTIAGNAGTVLTKPIQIKVVGTLGDIADNTPLRPALPPRELLVRDWFWLWASGIAAAALAGLCVVALLLRRRRRRRNELTGGLVGWRDLGSASKRALEKLKSIRDSGALEAEPVAAVVATTTVVKTFLGEQHGFRSEEMTTAELVQALEQHCSSEQREAVIAWFRIVDRVKYAAAEPTSEDAVGLWQQAQAMIVTHGRVAPETVTAIADLTPNKSEPMAMSDGAGS